MIPDFLPRPRIETRIEARKQVFDIAEDRSKALHARSGDGW